jgi:hypothetical protein
MASAIETLLLAQTAQLAVPVSATPVSTSSPGTASSGTTETFDTVLGYYQTSLIAGRRYMVVVNNLLCGATVANDVYALRVHNSGSSSNPTSGSTTIAQSDWLCVNTGGAGETTVPLAGSFIAPATGINTFGLSMQRIAGTGVGTPLSPSSASRELYVMYLGVV